VDKAVSGKDQEYLATVTGEHGKRDSKHQAV